MLMKKYLMIMLGVTTLLLGMGLNFQYALDDYGLADNKAVMAVWALKTEIGDPGGGTGPSGTGCDNCNKGGGIGSASCGCTSSNVTVGGSGGGGDSCSVSVNDGYYACCRKTQEGVCFCPSCKN